MATKEEAAKPAGKMVRVWMKGERTIAGGFGVFRPDAQGWCEVPEKLAKGLIEQGYATKDGPKD